MNLIAFVTAKRNRRRAGSRFPKGKTVAVELTGKDDPVLDALEADPVLKVEVKEAKDQTEAESQLEPEPDPQPEPQSEPEPDPQPEPQSEPEPDPQPDPQPEPEPVLSDEEKRIATLREFLSSVDSKPQVGVTEKATGVNTSGKEIADLWAELHPEN